ncbi:benzoylformate decarboxylase [Caballeronia udeis]|uniref:Benzoylformate decarboxylase n=1 Tax=Caballeronia udeis TaxID=1232866 RepID=A0A158JJ28_9BURK|nr:thiamine pyrophosphate-requiring protein [Caballeronia udeis]SAL68625.1 benzoylformate decarboxylase [Caballeronia udeis]
MNHLSDSLGATGGEANLSVAEAYLGLLKRRGIECLYMGAGTDTAPLVEAYARNEGRDEAYPRAYVITHENVAVGMAHGYYMVSGRPQAVMLHVSVGAANAVCALLNAARSQVPMLFTAGRTPLFEQGCLGARDSEIHWAQEMFDQNGMLREIVKWEYELRAGIHLEQVIDRALTIAMAQPRGPVALTLPREVLAESMVQRVGGVSAANTVSSPVPTELCPDDDAITHLADVLSKAAFPVIACTGSGADTRTVELVSRLCERHGVGVVEAKSRYVSVPASHPMHLGYDVTTALEQADAVLFLESDVPWVPGRTGPQPGAFVAHAGTDPLFARYPMRSFRSDLTITGSAFAVLRALSSQLERRCDSGTAAAAIAIRRARMSDVAAGIRHAHAAAAAADEQSGGAITKLFLSRCLNQLRPDDALVVNEYPARREQLSFDMPGTFFGVPPSAGLGWGLPAALGAQQVMPERTVIAMLGDGAYLFANPASCHHAAAMHGLPVLTIIYNNQRWDAVSSSAARMYPGAYASRAIARHGSGPLSQLAPLPQFEKYCEASGGYGERVIAREDLLPALQRALRVVTQERRQALLNVIGA